MSAIEIITQKLLDSPDYVAIVGDKVFPIMAPQNTQRPYTVLHLIDNDDTPTLSGAGAYYRAIVQLDHYCEMTPAGAKQVIRLGDVAIEALNGTVKERIAGAVDVDILLGSADFTANGLEANTHLRHTQFSCRWRVQPGEPADEDDDPAPGDFAFTMTAGTGNGATGYAGLVHFAGWGPFGSVSAEPILTFPLQSVSRHASTGSVVAFTGDVTTLVAGKSVWVDGVNYGPGVQYSWQYVQGVTIWCRITGGPTFVNGQSYDIEIK